MISLTLCAALLILLMALGDVILGLLIGREAFDARRCCFSVGIGLGAASLGIALLGALGFLYAKPIAAILGMGAILLWKREVRILWICFRGLSNALRTGWTGGRKFLVACLLLTVAIDLILALSPPTGWDAAVYHLTVPKLFLKQHRIFFIPTIMHSNGPLNIEMLFALGMVLWNDILAKLFHFSLGLFTLVAIYGVAERHLSLNAGWYAIVVFATMPVAFNSFGYANIDMGVAFYVILTFWAFRDWVDSSDDRVLVLTGIFCGLALGSKYTGTLAVGLFVGGVVVRCVMEKVRAKAGVRRLGIVIATVGILGCPWYVRNAINTGNPVFPMFGRMFDTR